MAMSQDIRWRQRYDNFRRACARLFEVTASDRGPDDLSDLEKGGLIQWFEFSYELAWKTLQDLLEAQGYDFVKGPNGTLRQALRAGLIDDQDGWRAMARARTLTSHTYDEQTADEISRQVYALFAPLLSRLCDALQGMADRLDE